MEINPDAPGMCGLDVACVCLFFSFTYKSVNYPCALTHWFSHVGESADVGTGMWVVEPDLDEGKPIAAIIHLGTIICALHFLPVPKEKFVSRALSFTDTLDTFQSFHVNKYIDHHVFEIAF